MKKLKSMQLFTKLTKKIIGSLLENILQGVQKIALVNIHSCVVFLVKIQDVGPNAVSIVFSF